MHQKNKTDLVYLWGKIKARIFDQDSIIALLMSAREALPKNSLARDIGDFVAHVQRDKGKTHSLSGVFDIKQNGNSVAIYLPSAPNVRELKPSLQSIFEAVIDASADDIKAVIDAVFNDIVACVFAILHGTTLKHRGGSDQILRIFEPPMLTSKVAPNLQVMACSSDGTQLCMFSSGVRVWDYIDPELHYRLAKVDALRAIRDESGKLHIREVLS